METAKEIIANMEQMVPKERRIKLDSNGNPINNGNPIHNLINNITHPINATTVPSSTTTSTWPDSSAGQIGGNSYQYPWPYSYTMSNPAYVRVVQLKKKILFYYMENSSIYYTVFNLGDKETNLVFKQAYDLTAILKALELME